MKNEPSVCIILVNWNGWADTIECLDSILKINYNNYKVYVCENGSNDKSYKEIEKWFNEFADNRFHFISSKTNLGFAGGNNFALRIAIKEDFNYFWFLNNDTIVEENSLKNLVRKMLSDINIGICGAKLVYYDFRKQIQAYGGVINKYFGTTRHILTEDDIEKIDYVVGASMFVKKEFIDEIGLMSEEYFLYYEELDWAYRCKGKYKITCAIDSVVYHKEGKSTGGRINKNNKSYTSDYYNIRSRLIFSHKYLRKYLFFVYLGLFVTIINRIKRKQFNRILMIYKIVKEINLGNFKG